MTEPIRFYATAIKGTEGALRDELRELRVRGVRAGRGGVDFAGDWGEGLRVCLESRIAVRVLAHLSTFEAADAAAFYDGVAAIDWDPFFGKDSTLVVRASGGTAGLTHTQYVARLAKDAIVDQMRERRGSRPSVHLDDADVVVFVRLAKERAEVYVDAAGESLHRRGYRARIGEAPLKETLAAAMIRLSGWDRASPFVDPMCGSGTIALEAALWARGVAPGLSRPRFGIERWALWDDGHRRRARELREGLQARVVDRPAEVFASDVDPALVDVARANARAAAVPLKLSVADVAHVAPRGPRGWVVTNPPYGERLEGSRALYASMGRAFRALAGHSIAILAGTSAIADAMGPPPTRWVGVMNGSIECRLLVYEL